MAASSSSTTPQLKNYDVFLSFRGEDTHYNFTSHLYVALCRKKIETFKDDQLIRGDEISSSLLNTIKASKISVIIFSQNYASSRWCLQELEQILDCKKTKQQIVLPIFYKVDPSHVRHQKESFGKGFAELLDRFKEQPEMLQRWKNALNEAANQSGWTMDGKTSEPELIDEISGDILKRLNKLSSSDYKGLVGVEFSINKIESLLHKGSNGVSKIGIWGIGGIGKTTIARVVFNKFLSQFEGSYFVENVREELAKNSRLTHLKKGLLSTILDDRDPNIGLTYTRERLQKQKVLIVFDDVTSSQQIEDLIENLNLLSSESQIIITTRDKQVLRNCDIDDACIYEVEGLREEEAHQLFYQYAFRQYPPTADYMELSKKAVAYSKGVPLALKVLGSNLFSKEKEFWESAIKKLEKGPPLSVHNVLRVGYDGLEKDEKDIFLDIACFFKGEHIDLVIEILNACDLYAKQGIQVLIDKCLVLVTGYNRITMHDLLQEMGKKIARDDACKDIRLWHHVDILKVFRNYKGFEAVRSINLDISKISKAGLNCHVLSKMDNLRFFEVYSSQYQDNYENKLDGFEELESFPNDIALFCWNNYPFKSVPLCFPSENLVKLDMRDNKVKHWNGFQNVVNLKYVDLSFSKHMTEIPNLSRASNIQELILVDCTSLLEIAPLSIQNLNKLVNLDLDSCTRLISLPDYIQSKSINLSSCYNLKIAPKISCKVEKLQLISTAIKESPFIEHPSRLVELDLQGCSWLESLSSSICKLKFLKHLNLERCSKLERLPDDIGNLEALELLWLPQGTAIKEVPSSILHLPKITELVLRRPSNKPEPLNWVLNSSSGSTSLVILDLANCQLTKLPDNLGQLSSLEMLYLCGNNFESLPECIKGLSNLYSLNISNCRGLRLLPELPLGVNVNASNCSSLQSISDPSFLLLPNWKSRGTIFANCFKLDLSKILHEESCGEFCSNIYFPGHEIPEWFTFQNIGSYITLDQPLDWHNKNFLGYFISAVVYPKAVGFNVLQHYRVTCYCLIKTEDGKKQIYRNCFGPWEDNLVAGYFYSSHVLFSFYSITDNTFQKCDREYHEISCEMESLDCKVLIKFHAKDTMVKKCGIHFLYVEDYGEPLETSGGSVDNAKKKGKEKEKNELQCCKLQISNSFDGISSLRPRFMSISKLDIWCLEARYWKLKRNALREIVKTGLLNFQQNTILCSEVEEMNCVNPKGCMSFPGSEIPVWFSFQNASYYIKLPQGSFTHDFAGLAFCTIVEFPDSLDLGQPFFVKCELFSKGRDHSIIAIGSIQGWFEGDTTHYIKSDHVFLGYDCVMYADQASYLRRYNSNAKAIIIFHVTNHDGVLIEGCKVKKCGVRLLCTQDFENKWKNPLDLSFLKRRLKHNGNYNDEPPSYGLSTTRDWQSTNSTALDLNEYNGNARCNDESQSSALSTTRDLQSSCFNSFDLNEIPQHSVGSTVNSATIKSSYADSNVVLSNGSTCCDDEPQSCGISTTRDWNSNSFVLPDLNQFPEDSVESMVNVATINKSGCVDDEQQSCGVSTTYDWQFGRFTSLDLNELPQDIVEPTVNVATINRIGYCDDEQKYYGISISCDGTSSRLTTLDLNELPQDFIASMNNVATINEPQPISCFCFMNILVSKLKDFLLRCDAKRCEDDKEAEGLNPSTSQPTGFAVFDRDDEDELQPKRLKEFKFF